nr:MAG TPA: virion protein [Caudoviricetes sp.]
MSEIMKIRAQGYLIGILALILGIWSISQSLEFRELKEKNAELNQKAEKLAVQLEARQMEIDALEELRLEELRIMSAIENSKVDTLAVRNNNPLNIKAIKTPWKGQIGTDRHGHAVFDDPAHGIRAAANVLINYYLRHGLDTLNGVVGRFCTGNREQYVAYLSRRLGLRPDESFNILDRLPELLQAMARFESGKEWDRSLFLPYSLISVAHNKGANGNCNGGICTR